MDLDEWLFAGLEACHEKWTKHASDSEGASSDVEAEAEKGGEIEEMKEEMALQKEKIAGQQEELALQKDQVGKQSEEIAMLRETLQKMQESIAAFSSTESIPQCAANESLAAHSSESGDTTGLDAVTGEKETTNTTKGDNSSQRGHITAPQCKDITIPSARDVEQGKEESQVGAAISDCEAVSECEGDTKE